MGHPNFSYFPFDDAPGKEYHSIQIADLWLTGSGHECLLTPSISGYGRVLKEVKIFRLNCPTIAFRLEEEGGKKITII